MQSEASIMAKKVTTTIIGISPYSQSKHYDVPKLDHGKESAKDYESRTWRERLHVDETGEVFIPPMALKNCLSDIARYLSIQIPGKGKATYTKHFEAGVAMYDPIMLGIKKDEVKPEWLFVPSDGKRGGGKRVEKCFPLIPKGWSGDLVAYVLDETITQAVFAQHMTEAGQFIGIGRFRPRNNGFYGRFKIENLKWEEYKY